MKTLTRMMKAAAQNTPHEGVLRNVQVLRLAGDDGIDTVLMRWYGAEVLQVDVIGQTAVSVTVSEPQHGQRQNLLDTLNDALLGVGCPLRVRARDGAVQVLHKGVVAGCTANTLRRVTVPC